MGIEGGHAVVTFRLVGLTILLKWLRMCARVSHKMSESNLCRSCPAHEYRQNEGNQVEHHRHDQLVEPSEQQQDDCVGDPYPLYNLSRVFEPQPGLRGEGRRINPKRTVSVCLDGRHGELRDNYQRQTLSRDSMDLRWRG